MIEEITKRLIQLERQFDNLIKPEVGGYAIVIPAAVQGNILVGDATPSWSLLSAKTNGAILVGNGTTLTSVTSPMFVDLANSRIGIGTTSPGSKLAVVGLTDYANNAAAITGGLAAGDFYTETGTNPKRVCVVY